MKCQIPQISWHGRDPVLSVDFQLCQEGTIRRLATAGTDSHVLIWYVSLHANNTISVECACDLNRHQKSVNVVRFSPNGEMLASGDDEGAIFLWKQKDREQLDMNMEEGSGNKEDWALSKLLRGHLDDVCDLSWSPDGNFILSGSIDNTAIVWDIQKGQKLHILSESKGFVQGVAWDPLNQYLASLSSDRVLRIHNTNTRKVMHKVYRVPTGGPPSEKGPNKSKLFHDDTLQSFSRRLNFSPDGELLFAPSGIKEKDEKFIHTTYVFSRHEINKPVLHFPTGMKYTVAVRCCPILYKLTVSKEDKNTNEIKNSNVKPMLNLPYRILVAVATQDSVFLYDTQQLLPFAFVSNIHYTHLTDLAWSSDGRMLIASSTDGYCSFIIFSEEELGEKYEPEPEHKISVEQNPGCVKVNSESGLGEKLVSPSRSIVNDGVKSEESIPDVTNVTSSKNNPASPGSVIDCGKSPKTPKPKLTKKGPASKTSTIKSFLSPPSAKCASESGNTPTSSKRASSTSKKCTIKSFFSPPGKTKSGKIDESSLEDCVPFAEKGFGGISDSESSCKIPKLLVTFADTKIEVDLKKTELNENIPMSENDKVICEGHDTEDKVMITSEGEKMDCDNVEPTSSSNKSVPNELKTDKSFDCNSSNDQNMDVDSLSAEINSESAFVQDPSCLNKIDETKQVVDKDKPMKFNDSTDQKLEISDNTQLLVEKSKETKESPNVGNSELSNVEKASTTCSSSQGEKSDTCKSKVLDLKTETSFKNPSVTNAEKIISHEKVEPSSSTPLINVKDKKAKKRVPLITLSKKCLS